MIAATPTSQIGMATPGYRAFAGTAEAVDGLLHTSPLTHSPCVWFHAKLEKWTTTRGSESAHWSTMRDETSVAPFLIRDSTGVAVVHTWGAEVTPADKSVWYGRRPEPEDRSPARVAPADWSSPAVEMSGGSNSRYRYTEERIHAGSPLLILGEFSSFRFTSSFDAEADEASDDAPGEGEDDDKTDRDAESSARAGRRGQWEDEALIDRILDAVGRMSNGHVDTGTGQKPFVITTTMHAVHLARSEMGSQAALSLAPAPLLVAAFLLWVRFA